MKAIAFVTVLGLSLAACGSPSQGAGASGAGDSPISNAPDRPPPDDVATIPPTDQCEPGAVLTDDDGDALQHERCPANTDYEKKYELVEPQPGMVQVHPIPWAGVATSDDGRMLTVRFWSGVEPCSVLDHVDVSARDRAVTVTLYEGRKPDSGDVACIEVAVLKAVRIELDAPLGDRKVEDGARGG
jgi:hypothetical protein